LPAKKLADQGQKVVWKIDISNLGNGLTRREI
jgi:hypothetical protein